MATEFDGISALFINCSLKTSGEQSHTMRLVRRAEGLMSSLGASVEVIHALDHDIAFGMAEDMSSDDVKDDWPDIQKRVDAADILVLATPIWLGVKSSVATLVVERLYAGSAETNDKGQYRYYGKAAGCLVSGNEDGVKACSRDVLYAMQHIGYMIPPQADAGWLGPIGPGPSYGDPGEGDAEPVGYDSEFTNKNMTIMCWNLLHTATMLKPDGVPARGNVAERWDDLENAGRHDPDPVAG